MIDPRLVVKRRMYAYFSPSTHTDIHHPSLPPFLLPSLPPSLPPHTCEAEDPSIPGVVTHSLILPKTAALQQETLLSTALDSSQTDGSSVVSQVGHSGMP